MDKALMVFLGAGLGGLGRFYLAAWLQDWGSTRLAGFPLGTLAVNLLGSLAIGVLAAVGGEQHHVKHLLIIGLLGGFTTFSSFSRDSVDLVLLGRHGTAAAYIALSLGSCILGAWLGMVLGRAVISD
jgi:CrcB protein